MVAVGIGEVDLVVSEILSGGRRGSTRKSSSSSSWSSSQSRRKRRGKHQKVEGGAEIVGEV